MPAHPSSPEQLRLEVLSALSSAAGEDNEDGYALLEDQIWVIDAASGLADHSFTPGPSDAAWLTATVVEALRQEQPLPIESAVGRIVNDLRARLDAFGVTAAHSPHELPSASLAAIWLRGTDLEVLTLGDCRLIMRTFGDAHLHVTESVALDRLDQQAVAELRAERQRTGADLRTGRARILPTLRRNRDLMNRPGGYRALAVNLDLTDLGIQTLNVDAGTIGLLVSDGLYRLVDTFHRYGPADLLAAAERDGLDALMDELRALETADPDADRFGRLKMSDDATAVLFQITAA